MALPLSTHPRLSWLALGFASGMLLSISGIGLLKGWKDGDATVAAQPTARSSVIPPGVLIPLPGDAAAASAADLKARNQALEAERARYAAQLANAEAEWTQQLETALSGSEEARREAVKALDDLYQTKLAREREQHVAELEQLRSAYETQPSADQPSQAQPAVAYSDPPQPFSLLERARSAEVALALGPFLEPGFAQLDNSMSKTALPFSYAELAATGALTAAPEGWRTLYKIGSSSRDRARTRWPAEPDAADLAAAQRAQELLVELGPALVQIGKLRP